MSSSDVRKTALMVLVFVLDNAIAVVSDKLGIRSCLKACNFSVVPHGLVKGL